jgi:hypothetical protein
MASHDGRRFKRWLEPLIPEDAPQDRDGNRSNYMTWGLVQLPGNNKEYSVYATEAYYTGPDSRVRRFTFRTDGFVSLRGGPETGSLTTKPVKFAGDQLQINMTTRKGGTVRVELQSEDGQPLEGYSLEDCQPMAGDSLAQRVVWAGGDIGKLAGRAIRIRFVVHGADVYSFRFQ